MAHCCIFTIQSFRQNAYEAQRLVLFTSFQSPNWKEQQNLFTAEHTEPTPDRKGCRCVSGSYKCCSQPLQIQNWLIFEDSLQKKHYFPDQRSAVQRGFFLLLAAPWERTRWQPNIPTDLDLCWDLGLTLLDKWNDSGHPTEKFNYISIEICFSVSSSHWSRPLLLVCPLPQTHVSDSHRNQITCSRLCQKYSFIQQKYIQLKILLEYMHPKILLDYVHPKILLEYVHPKILLEYIHPYQEDTWVHPSNTDHK